MLTILHIELLAVFFGDLFDLVVGVIVLNCAIFFGAGAIWRNVACKLGNMELIRTTSCMSDAASVDAHFFIYFFVGLAGLEASGVERHNTKPDNNRLE